MAQKRRPFNHNKRQAARLPTTTRTLQRLPDRSEVRPPVVYGKPFLLLEDREKNTFIYKAGGWIPYPVSIAECRQTCLVKELPQRVKEMVRYEVQCPLGMEP